MKTTLSLIIASALFMTSCEKNKFDKSSYTKETVFGAKSLALSSDRMNVIVGLARCYFGDLDAAHLDTKYNGKDSFWFTIEKISPNEKPHKTIYSKKVTKKDFYKNRKLKIGKFPDGVYGYFLCSGDKKSCTDKDKKILSINPIITAALFNGEKDSSPKVYSANFFIKRGKYIVAQQLKRGGDAAKEEYLREFKKHFSEEDSASYWNTVSEYLFKTMPNPAFMPTDKDAYDKNFKDEDIVFEFPMLDTKLCNYDDMVKIYKPK